MTIASIQRTYSNTSRAKAQKDNSYFNYITDTPDLCTLLNLTRNENNTVL